MTRHRLGLLLALLVVGLGFVAVDGAHAQTTTCDGNAFRQPHDPHHAYSIRNNLSETVPSSHDDNILDEAALGGKHNITSQNFELDGSPFYTGDDCRRTDEGNSVQLNTSLDDDGTEDFMGFAAVRVGNIDADQYNDVLQKRDGVGNVHIQVNRNCDGSNNDGVRVTLADQSSNFPNVEECTSLGSKFEFSEHIFFWRYTNSNSTFEVYRTQSQDDGSATASLLNASLVKIGTINEPDVGDDLSAADGDNQFFQDNNIVGKVHHYRWYRNANATLGQLQSVAVEPFQGLEAGFTFSCTDRTCDFSDDSSVGEGFITERNWTFGDGESNTGNNATEVTHTYDSFGSFEVTLTVTENSGETDSTSQTVTLGLSPEFNVSAGLVADSTLEHIGVSWDRGTPSVWGRDVRTSSDLDDGKLLEWNETLTNQRTVDLCPDDSQEETNQEEGLAVSKDLPGRPVTACVETAGGSSNPVYLVRESDGGVTATRNAGSSSGAQVHLDARSLNNVSVLNLDDRFLEDAVDGDNKWSVLGGDSFAHMAMDRASDEDPLVCFTGGTFGTGTECRDVDGFTTGSDDGLNGDDIGVHDDIVFVLDNGGPVLERRTDGLGSLNSTTLEAQHRSPLAVSKGGNLLAHVNRSGAERLVVRHAVNGSKIAETEGLADDINDLAFHPRGERLYTVNDTRIWAFNLTDLQGFGADETSTEDTTSPADEEEPAEDEDDPFGIDISSAANALGIDTEDAEVFYGSILILGMAASAVFSTWGQGVEKEQVLVFIGMAGALVGLLLTNFLGWIPMWFTFLVFAAFAALLVSRFGVTRSGGG